jgi:hypothetical protein
MKRITSMALLVLVTVVSLFSQTPNAPNTPKPSQFAGTFWARAFAYGVTPNIGPLFVATGNSATGSSSITLVNGIITTPDGITYMPLAVDAPITVGSGSNQETVTPSAVNCKTPTQYGTCTITATFANIHGTGDYVTTGTVGLQEALNYALALGGGEVTIDYAWSQFGGTTSMISSAYIGGYFSGLGNNNGWAATVDINDNRSLGVNYWDIRPTAATTISAGSAVTLTQSSGGSLTSTGTYYVSYWYVDALGGISPPATDSSQITLTGSNQTITTSAPAATTGAAGWIPLITASGGSTGTEIMVPVTSSVCTVSTLETVIPACAIGATATISANPSSTAKEFVTALATAHTTLGPVVFNSLPSTNFLTNFPPFGSVATVSSGSNADVALVYVPAGYFNYLGKSVDVCFTAASTDVSTAVPTWNLTMANQYGQSPATIVSIALPTATGALVTSGCFTISTAVTGSSGKFWGGGTLVQAQGTTTLSAGTTTATTSLPASGNPNLTQGVWLALNLGAATANITGVTVNQFYLKPVNNN